MNSRQKKILQYLSDQEAWIKGKELSKIMNVTDRTIRSDIDTLNKEYSGLIESSRREGYRINQKMYRALSFDEAEAIPQTPEERSIYIIKKLLFHQKHVSLFELQEQLFVSEHTIEGDIKRIRDLIRPYTGLTLVRENNQLFFKGTEPVKRKIYRDLLTKEIQGNFLNLDKIATVYNKFDLLEVMKIFENLLHSYNYEIRETAVPMIIVHIGITIERMLSRNYLEKQDMSQEIIETMEYAISEDFFKQIAPIIPVAYQQQEVIGLAAILIGYKDAHLLKEEVEFKGEMKSIPLLLNEILTKINEQFDLDFSHDEDFINGLHLHIQSLVNRMKRRVIIPNAHLQEVKKLYPLIFEMGIYVGQLIADYFDSVISESEAGFLALHLGAAYDRLSIKHRHQVLLIIPGNQSLSQLTKGKIVNMFKERMEIVEVSKYFTEKDILNKGIDLVISTLPIQHELDVLTIQVSMFVSHEDESRIFSALNELDKRRFMMEFGNQFGTLIDERFFFADLDFETPEEVIAYMAQELTDENVTAPDFKDSVLQREAMSSTSFAYSIAIPHPLNLVSHQSKVAIANLKQPIQWGDYTVKLVMLLAIKEEDSAMMWLFFDWLSETITDAARMTKLLDSKTRNEFVYWMMNN